MVETKLLDVSRPVGDKDYVVKINPSQMVLKLKESNPDKVSEVLFMNGVEGDQKQKLKCYKVKFNSDGETIVNKILEDYPDIFMDLLLTTEPLNMKLNERTKNDLEKFYKFNAFTILTLLAIQEAKKSSYSFTYSVSESGLN